jgi:putative spermidine/putrescine transport system permease protein
MKNAWWLRIGLSVLVAFPFAVLAFLSVSRRWIFPGVLPESWSAEAWTGLFSAGSDLLSSLLLSLVVSLLIATLVTFLAFVCSRALAYSKWGERLLPLAYFPYVFAPVILAAILQFYFIASGLSGNIQGVVLAQLFITFPFGIILFMSFWNEKIKALEGLVATMGGSPWLGWRKVVFPLARNLMSVVFFQTFLISWFEYGLTRLIGLGKIQTLTIKVFQYVSEANTADAAVASCLLVIPPAILLWLNKKYVFQGLEL